MGSSVKQQHFLANLDEYWHKIQFETESDPYFSKINSFPSNWKKARSLARLRFALFIIFQLKNDANNRQMTDDIKQVYEELLFFYAFELARSLAEQKAETYSEGPIESPIVKVDGKNKKKKFIKTVFDVGKKLFDLIDDTWNAMKGLLPVKIFNFVTPISTGVIGFVINSIEGLEGFKQAKNAYRNKRKAQRKTQIGVGVLTGLLAGTGIGLSIALLISTAGVEVVGKAIIPGIVPTLLTTIYALALMKKIYIYAQAKKQEVQAKIAYEDSLEQANTELNSLQIKFTAIACKINDITQQKNLLSNKIQQKQFSSESEQYQYNKYIHSLEELKAEAAIYQKQLVDAQENVIIRREEYFKLNDKCFRSERDVAFTTVEVLSSVLVTTFSILGMGTLLAGASVGSLGIVPTMVILGVVIGAVSKAFEAFDERNNFKYTKMLRDVPSKINNWALEKINKLFSHVHKPAENISEQILPKSLPSVKPVCETTSQIFAIIPPSQKVNKGSIGQELEPITPLPHKENTVSSLPDYDKEEIMESTLSISPSH